MTFQKIFLFIFCVAATSGFAQLSDFNFNVSATDETCAGNGTLNMSVSNTTPGASVAYELFLSPDFTNAIAATTAASFGSLPSGNYRVVATQTLGIESNTQQQDAVIQDLVVDLDFEISYNTVADCDVTGTIIVTVLSGTPTSYEILSGPVTVPPQDSNEFSGLPSGTYMIRVFDDCDDALSKSFTMLLDGMATVVSPGMLPPVFDSCTAVEITSSIVSNLDIAYPITIVQTVFPPDGSPNQVTSTTYQTGDPLGFDIVHNIPLFGDLPFAYSLSLTDNCGNEFVVEQDIDPNPVVALFQNDAPCGNYYLTLGVNNYFPPITVNFTAVPGPDFNPINFNATYPGPFDDPTIDFGDEENPVPFGQYEVTIVDACGRTGTAELLLEFNPLIPIVTSANNGCGSAFGLLRIEIPQDRLIISAIITGAPAGYAVPNDVTALVSDEGILLVTDLPVGDYALTVIDDCSHEYLIEVTVPEYVIQDIVAVARPNCDPATGSVRLTSPNGPLTSVTMTAKPLAYEQTLPYDVSFNINASGVFYMNDLPAGTYTFEGVDGCGFELEITVDVTGYTSTPNGYQLTRNCGSFHIGVFDSDTSVTGQTYWFQRFFPETNTWGHPNTGVGYTEGEIPNPNNAVQMQNFVTIFNIFLTGEFRIIKVFQSFNNGSSDNNCLDIFASFTVSSELVIAGAYSLDCNGGSGPSDIVLDVIGVAPYNFTITEPFFFDNGDDNVFTNLAPGIYNFRVEDFCGSRENILVEVGTLLPLARANAPLSMLVCRDDGAEVGVFVLSDQNPQILGNQDPNFYTVSYHATQADANSGSNPLAEAYTNTSNPQTIYARVAHNEIELCYATTSFGVFIGSRPVLGPADPGFVCEGASLTLTADPGFGAYEWSTGETTQSISVTSPGNYSVIVKNVYDDFTCDASKEFTVTGSGIASFQNIDTSDWSPGNNTITVFVTGPGAYEYSLDEETYQDANTFTNLLPGKYTVYVRDKNGCGTINATFALLNYPNFFTPNGDGYNDTWHVKFAAFEPEMEINIFDRYGKFLIQLNGQGPGWDGTYNGHALPSTDYWFVVERIDGTTHKGHFALKR